ncbi:MAG: DUF262 domain-containing protein [Mycoplasmoidaceae bacterium]|nr:DUF262 domain-containing protein [Mycoplasmoidaceae bacterium]
MKRISLLKNTINKFQKTEATKYRLKPQISDDGVYQKILDEMPLTVEDKKRSKVYAAYNLLKEEIDDIIKHGSTINDIVDAIYRFNILFCPIDPEIIKNPQEVFETINSTGVDLTAQDLIRNFLLMNLNEETQTKFYEKY